MPFTLGAAAVSRTLPSCTDNTRRRPIYRLRNDGLSLTKAPSSPSSSSSSSRVCVALRGVPLLSPPSPSFGEPIFRVRSDGRLHYCRHFRHPTRTPCSLPFQGACSELRVSTEKGTRVTDVVARRRLLVFACPEIFPL